MRTSSALLTAFSLTFVLGFQSLFAAASDRITASIDNAHYVAVASPPHPLARPESDRGAVDATQRLPGISLDLRPTPSQQADLDAFLEEQRNPGSPDYHNWLTPAQFADRFGASQNDIAKIVAWLQAEGFSIQHVGAGRTWILFAGTAAQVERSFHTSIHHYFANGTMHYANSALPSIPDALSTVVGSIRGLDDFRPQPATNPAKAKTINPQLDRGGYQFVGPGDLAAIYDINALYNAGIDGKGQKLAIAGQTDIALLDIAEYRGLFNLPPNVPQVVLVGDDPGTSASDLPEADLDIEWSGSSAVNATIVYVNSANVFTSLQYAIDQDLAPVVSVSYGACEAGAPSAVFRTIAQQANAEGITWLNAAGDQGAAGCDYDTAIATNGPSVIFPANIPEVVAVGGTEFNEGSGKYWSTTNGNESQTALGYIPEKAWNDTSPGNEIEAGGGGVSSVFSKPWWQTGPGVPADGARDVPDLSLDASANHDGYIIVSSDTMMSIGGTSVASPAFAGMVLLVNQYLLNHGTLTQPGLGNINPTLYTLAQNSTDVFHDITVGNNIVPCQSGTRGCTTGSFGYDAGPGYDLATGLGTVDAYNLASGWSKAQAGVGVRISLTASPASISSGASTTLTATVTAVTGAAAPTGTVTFTENGDSLGSGTLKPGNGTSSTASLSVNSSLLGTGTHTVSADYLPTGSFLASSGSASVTVTGIATTITASASPATIAASASTVLAATVSAGSGAATPTGTVTFTDGNSTLGSAAVSGGVATLTVSGMRLASGANTISVTFVGTAPFLNSTARMVVTVNAVGTATTVVASPAAVSSTGATTLTAAITSASGATAPAGNVTFTAGSTNLGTVPVFAATSAAGSPARATATFSVRAGSLAIGANTITARYTSTNDFANSSGTAAVTVIPGTVTTLTANPSTILSSASTVLTASVHASGGSPAGRVTFSSGARVLGSASLTGSTASLTVQGSSLSVGGNTIIAAFTPTNNFSASSAQVTLVVNTPTLISVTASVSTVPAGSSTRLTATVTPARGVAVPTGNVTFSTGGTRLATVPLTAGATSATASLTVQAATLGAGNHSVTATYAGNSASPASSGTVELFVQ